jgi:hypothetical protein
MDEFLSGPTSAPEGFNAPDGLRVYRQLFDVDRRGNKIVPSWHVCFEIRAEDRVARMTVPIGQMDGLAEHISRLVAEARANAPHSRSSAGTYEIASL